MKLLITRVIQMTTIIMMVFFEQSYPQDFHLSQYDAATLYLNPALTGCYFKEKADYKIFADYRSQWKSVSKPFNTSYLAYDMSINRFGIGGYILNNHSGTGFNSFNFMLSGAYQIIDTKYSPHSLSVGLQIGILNKSFNPDKFTYDSQYSGSDPDGFDGNLSSNEVFSKTSLLKFDANFGIFYKFISIKSKLNPFAGFSVFHVTMPDESFTDTEKKLPMRFALNGGTDIVIHEGFKLTPSILFMAQEKATEFNGGVLGCYTIIDTQFDILFGINYRLDDAIILQCGIKQGGHIFRISYDITTSNLNKFSGNRGGMEFSLILTGKKKQPLF